MRRRFLTPTPFFLLAAALLGQAAPVFEPKGLLGDNTTFYHAGNVLALAWFPDGKKIVSCVDTRTLFVWDATTGGPLATAALKIRPGSLAVTPDGKQIVAGAPSGTVAFFAWPGLAPGKSIDSPGGGCPVIARGAHRAVCQNKDKLDFIDLGTGKIVSAAHRHPPGRADLRLAISPDGEWAASADPSGLVRTWKTAAAKSVLELRVAADGNYIHVAFTADGKRIVVDSNSAPATVFDATKPGDPAVFEGFHHLDETAGPPRLVGIRYDALVAVDPATGRELGRYDRPGPDALLAGAVSPDQKAVAVVVDHHQLRVLQLPDFAEQAAIKGPGARVTDLAFSDKSDRVAAASVDGYLHAWDLASKEMMKRMDGRFVGPPHSPIAGKVRWSADGQSVDGLSPLVLGRWTAGTGARTAELKLPAGTTGAHFAPDGESLLVPAGSSWRRMLPLNDFRVAAAFAGPYDTGIPPAFSGDGSKVALRIDQNTLGVADVAKGRLLFKTPAKGGRADRLLLSSAADALVLVGEEILVVQAKTGKEILKIPLKDLVRRGSSAQAWAISPDGAVLALSFDKPELHVWSLSDGALLQTLTGPRSLIQSAKFSRDGKWLAAAGWDRAIHLWSRK